MGLVRSTTVKEVVPLSDTLAKEDIVVENVHGQNVVVVAKGQPVPKDLEAYTEKLTAKAVAAPAENKARKAPQKQ